MMLLFIAFLCALIGGSLFFAVRARNNRSFAGATSDGFWDRDLDDLDWERADLPDPSELPRYRTPPI